MILSFDPNTIKNHLIERVKSKSSLLKAIIPLFEQITPDEANSPHSSKSRERES